MKIGISQETGIRYGLYLIFPKGQRESAIDYMEEEKRKEGKELFPLPITMPCGSSMTISERKDVPDSDVPCACGNQNHWLVVIKEVEPKMVCPGCGYGYKN